MKITILLIWLLSLLIISICVFCMMKNKNMFSREVKEQVNDYYFGCKYREVY